MSINCFNSSITGTLHIHGTTQDDLKNCMLTIIIASQYSLRSHLNSQTTISTPKGRRGGGNFRIACSNVELPSNTDSTHASV